MAFKNTKDTEVSKGIRIVQDHLTYTWNWADRRTQSRPGVRSIGQMPMFLV